MNFEIGTILASSTFATIATLFSTHLSDSKKNQIENITLERKEWRNNLGSIAIELEKALDYDKIMESIVELKVNINTFGFCDYNDIHADGIVGSVKFSEISLL